MRCIRLESQAIVVHNAPTAPSSTPQVTRTEEEEGRSGVASPKQERFARTVGRGNPVEGLRVVFDAIGLLGR